MDLFRSADASVSKRWLRDQLAEILNRTSCDWQVRSALLRM
jgi:hypothetical protein